MNKDESSESPKTPQSTQTPERRGIKRSPKILNLADYGEQEEVGGLFDGFNLGDPAFSLEQGKSGEREPKRVRTANFEPLQLSNETNRQQE